jgi:hypothetical protein
VRLVSPPGALDLNERAVDREHLPFHEAIADHRRGDAGTAADLQYAIPGRTASVSIAQPTHPLRHRRRHGTESVSRRQ